MKEELEIKLERAYKAIEYLTDLVSEQEKTITKKWYEDEYHSNIAAEIKQDVWNILHPKDNIQTR